MVRKPLFKCCLCCTNVYVRHRGIAGGYGRFVYATSETPTVKGELIWFVTVAAFKVSVALASCPTDTGVMLLDNRSYVRHTTVAYFDCVPIEYSIQLGAFGEVPIYKP